MTAHILQGDALQVLQTLPERSIRCCVTSPPYYKLRDYGMPGQLGDERTPEEYIERLVTIGQQIKRVLTDDGTFWLNLGDTRTKKQLLGIPWRVALALQADGWILRQDIIWEKPNGMPSSAKDRCTGVHEYLFHFSKSAKYYYDYKALLEPATWTSQNLKKPERGHTTKPNGNGQAPQRHGNRMTGQTMDGHRGAYSHNGKVRATMKGTIPARNKRSVWRVNTTPYKGAHFAVFPPNLIKPCIMAGSAPGDMVLDPFNGTGVTGAVAVQLGRHYTGIEINPAYITLTNQRLAKVQLTTPERAIPAGTHRQK